MTKTSMPALRVALAAGAAALAMTSAVAQTVPSATGDMTSAPRATAHGGRTIETAPAARTRARAHGRISSRTRSRGAGTASTGPGGADAATESGSAAPGGPGAPPPTLPVAPGTGPGAEAGAASSDASLVRA